jgi:hypothetical protein
MPHDSRRMLPRGFRMRLTKSRRPRHWQGGPPRHRGAKCPLCREPLRLIWDVDLSDPIFPPEFATALSPVTRLPLYFCCRCPSPTMYRVESDEKIQCFRAEPEKYEENSFHDSPAELPRRGIKFEPIPDDIEALLSLTEEIGVTFLSRESLRHLSKYVGQEVTSPWELPISQFGGLPLLEQGYSELVCPNRECIGSELEHPYPSLQRSLLLKELAVVCEHDSRLRENSQAAQIAYYICRVCFTIHAEYRCS